MPHTGSLKILHIEDNHADAMIVRSTLEAQDNNVSGAQYNITHMTDLAKGIIALSQNPYDAVLLDMNLPDGRGIDNIRSVREINPDVAIIVVTSSDDNDLAVSVLHEGAQEYIIKEYSESPFLKRVINSSILRKAAEVELARKAHFDILTGLPNRFSFENTVKSVMKRAERWDRHEALMFIDLDKFKQINDERGHEAGNEVLKEVAERLNQVMRNSDIIARYAGDEFVVYLDSSGRTQINTQNCRAIAEKVMKAMSKPMMIDGEPYTIEMSIGIAIYPQAGKTFDVLLKSADAAMYQAKRDTEKNYHIVGSINKKKPPLQQPQDKKPSDPVENQEHTSHSDEGIAPETYEADRNNKEVKTILIIDDSEEDRAIYRAMLETDKTQAYEILEAGSIRDGERLAEKHEPDCILLDYILPDMRGTEYLEKLEALSPPLRSAIIMITGQEDRRIAVEAMKHGAKDYVVKGQVDADRFLQVISNSIEKASLEERLRYYQKDLERSYRDLSEFSHVVAHDLKAPVRKIVTFCEMLNINDNKALGEDTRHYLERIAVSAKRMQNLVDTLLLLAQMEHQKEKRVKTNLSKIVQSATADIDSLIDEKKATIEVGEMGELLVYPFRLQQVLTNLISNAVKYSKDGKPPVIKITGAGDKGEGMYTICVEDNGVGIPKKMMKKIFTPFQRLHSADEIDGTGLGLSICQKAVEKHSGRLWAESQEGVGSKFYISLPNK